MPPSVQQGQNLARLYGGLTKTFVLVLLLWTFLPIGVYNLSSGQVLDDHRHFSGEYYVEGIFLLVVGSGALGGISTYRKAAPIAFMLFYVLALLATVVGGLQWVTAAVFSGMAAYVALLLYYFRARNVLRASLPAAPPQDPYVQLVFYMFDSEDQDIALADRIFVCTTLTGKNDFVADGDPNMTIQDVKSQIYETEELLTGSALDLARRAEIKLLQKRIRNNGRGYVGYQLEARHKSSPPN